MAFPGQDAEAGLRDLDVLGLTDFTQSLRHGSRAEEAQVIAAWLPERVHGLVVVTSPAHTRRTKMVFRHAVETNREVMVYTGLSPENSAEYYRPLWLEYAKLARDWLRS